MADRAAADRTPARHEIQDGGRDADGDVAAAERILPHTCRAGSDQTVQGTTRRRKKAREPRLRAVPGHRRSGMTMKQTDPRRKHIVQRRH